MPEARVAEGRENVLQPAIQHFACYAFAVGEREDLWHSGFSLACVESVSFVEKVGTKAKKMRGGKERKGILFSLPPSFIFLLSLSLSRYNSNGNVCYAVISTRYRLRRTLRVGGKDVFSLLFAVIVDEDEPVVNQSIVQEVVEASQISVSPELCRFD